MDSYDNRYAKAVDLIEEMTPNTVQTTYDYLVDNGDVLEAISNDSQNTRPRLVRLMQKPYAEPVIELIKSRIYDYRWNTIMDDIGNELVKRYVRTVVNTNEEDHAFFLNVILKDLLTSPEPNYRNSRWLTADRVAMKFDSAYDYYVFILDYADANGFTPAEIVSVIVKSPIYLDYFLRGEEYDELFRRYFTQLIPEECSEFIKDVDGIVMGYMWRPDDVQDVVRNYVYLSRRLRGYTCPRELGYDVADEFIELRNRIQYTEGDENDQMKMFIDRGRERVDRERVAAGLEELEDEDEIQVLEEILQSEFYTSRERLVEDGPEMAYAEYFDSLVEELPKYEEILL